MFGFLKYLWNNREYLHKDYLYKIEEKKKIASVDHKLAEWDEAMRNMKEFTKGFSLKEYDKYRLGGTSGLLGWKDDTPLDDKKIVDILVAEKKVPEDDEAFMKIRARLAEQAPKRVWSTVSK